MPENAFDWDEYLTLARNLVDLVSGEASVRASASRAYYAAYWKARLILEAHPVPIPRANIHKFVWQAFLNSWNEDGASIGKLGEALKSFRVKADYYAFPSMAKSDAEIAVANAESLIDDLDRISERDRAATISRAADLLKLPEYQP